jgi:carbonic anhydrase
MQQQSGGKMKSPIHIESINGTADETVTLHYEPSPLRIINTGHTVQVNLQPGSFMVIDDLRYDLRQFHFHVPGEHLIRQRTFAMEAHLVHQNSAGEYAVIGVFYNCGKPDPLIKTIWERLLGNKGAEQTFPDVIINPMNLTPADGQYFSCSGSLTTSPYTEGVSWILFQTPHSASTAQLEQFTALFGRNARPVQPLLGRKVLEGRL